jgi:hypothetical protein
MCKAYKAREGLGRSMRLEKVKRVGNFGSWKRWKVGNDGKLETMESWSLGRRQAGQSGKQKEFGICEERKERGM